MPRAPRLAALALAAALVSPAMADPVVINGITFLSGLKTEFNPQAPSVSGAPLNARSQFEGKLIEDSRKREGLTDAAVGSYPPSSGTPRSLRLETFGATVTSEPVLPPGVEEPFAGRVANGTTDPIANGRFDTTGNGGKWWLAAATFTIDFDAPIEAFGVYMTDAGDFSGNLGMKLKRSDGTSTGVFDLDEFFRTQVMAFEDGPSTVTAGTPDNGANNGWLQFLGFYDDQCSKLSNRCYTQVEFIFSQVDPNNTNSWDYLGFDDLIVGKVAPGDTGGDVPEPGSLALVGAGLLGFAAARRRKPRA